MRAALVKTLDGPASIVLQDIEPPTVGAGQVVVDVAYCALNFMDTLITRGKYQVKPELPFSPGAELAGTVSVVGEGVTAFKPGDRVASYLGYGCAREQVAVSAERLVRVPEGVTLSMASAMNVTYGTALYALRNRCEITRGQTLAVLGASGGAGLAAIEIGRQLGLRVIAVASTAKKLAVCEQHGAEVLIDYKSEDIKPRLRQVTGGIGPDIVYDCVGGPHLEPALRALKTGGSYIVIGFAAGDIPKIPANIVLLKDCNVLGIHWGAWVESDPAPHAENIALLLDWIASGALEPREPETRDLADISQAIEDLAGRRVIGKVALVLRH